MHRRALLALPLAGFAAPLARDAEAEAWRARLAHGGYTLLIRHTDTRGTGCDTTGDWRDAARQRHLSPEGRAQAVRLGEVLRPLPHETPVLASPVPRAFETALLAMGQAAADERLLSDEFAGPAFDEMIESQRALLHAPVPRGLNRFLFGHLGSALTWPAPRPTQAAFPEGSTIVLREGRVLAVVEFAPIPGGGAHSCR
jgi:phosphohistidine phosphatase SixA